MRSKRTNTAYWCPKHVHTTTVRTQVHSLIQNRCTHMSIIPKGPSKIHAKVSPVCTITGAPHGGLLALDTLPTGR